MILNIIRFIITVDVPTIQVRATIQFYALNWKATLKRFYVTCPG